MAWACWRQGHIGLAKDLYAAAEADLEWDHKGDAPQDFVERLAGDFTYMETWRATVDCGSQMPRPELLKKFRWLQKNFPKSEYANEVADKIAMYEQMVAEDTRHAQERAAGVPFEQLSQSEQIAELIFQLRDQNGQQWSQPGSCHVLHTADGRDDSPGHHLVAYGYDAIPQLAAALGDERLTRSVGYHRNFYFSHHVLTVGTAAEQLLEHIASRSFDGGDEKVDAAAQLQAMRDRALAWHSELMSKGERICLVEAVERADEHSASVAQRLVEKYPDAACTAILAALRKTEDEYDRGNFIEMLGATPSDESLPFLVDELNHQKVWLRVKAAEALTGLGRPEGIDEMLRQWESSSNVSDVEVIGPFLAGCGRVEAVQAVTKRFTEQSLDERLSTMSNAADGFPVKVAGRLELRQTVIDLLLKAIHDTEVRSGMSGSYGDKSFSDPRVCDLAGYHLNELDPTAFPFDLGAPFNQRERERLAILAASGR